MIKDVLDFVGYIKEKGGFYTESDNLEEKLAFSEDAFDFTKTNTKFGFNYLYGREITDEDLKWIKISHLELDWELTIENIYLYGGFKNSGFLDALISPGQPDYRSIDCKHKFFTEEEKHFLQEETNWFSGSAHGMGNGTYGIFHRTKDKYPFDILYLDEGLLFKTDFTLERYYQSMIDSMAVCGWQYFYLDFEEIKTVCANYKVGQRWLTIYPYSEGLTASPLGRNVTHDTTRLDALLHHMEVCVYLLPKIFPDKSFDYHAQRLSDFKAYLNR